MINLMTTNMNSNITKPKLAYSAIILIGLVCLVILFGASSVNASFLLNLGYSYMNWLDNADVDHHDITVKIDTQKHTAEFLDYLHIIATKNVRIIYIILGVDFSLDEIVDLEGNPVQFRVHMSMEALPFVIYRLDLPRTIVQGEEYTLCVNYSHTPDTIKYTSLFMSESVFFAAVPMIWYPQMPTEDFFTASIKVDTDLNAVISEGEPVEGTDGKEWRTDRAIAGLNLVAGDLEPADLLGQSKRAVAWKGVGQSSHAIEMLGFLVQSIEVLERKLGELELSRLDLVSLPVWFGGSQSGYSMTVTDDYLHYIDINTPLLRAYLAAHEAAHKWVGYTAGFNILGTGWLLEGLADYLAFLTIEEIYGMDALREIMISRSLQPLSVYTGKMRAIKNIELIDEDQEIAKQKGALVLRAMHRRMGDSAFYEGIETFVQEFKGKNASAEQFISIMEEVSGHKLDSFVKDWVNGTHVLDYALEGVGVETVEDVYQLSLKVTSKGKLVEPDPIEIDIYLADQTVVRVEAPAIKVVNTWQFPQQVVRVVLDPDLWIPDWNRDNNTWVLSE